MARKRQQKNNQDEQLSLGDFQKIVESKNGFGSIALVGKMQDKTWKQGCILNAYLDTDEQNFTVQVSWLHDQSITVQSYDLTKYGYAAPNKWFVKRMNGKQRGNNARSDRIQTSNEQRKRQRTYDCPPVVQSTSHDHNLSTDDDCEDYGTRVKPSKAKRVRVDQPELIARTVSFNVQEKPPKKEVRKESTKRNAVLLPPPSNTISVPCEVSKSESDHFALVRNEVVALKEKIAQLERRESPKLSLDDCGKLGIIPSDDEQHFDKLSKIEKKKYLPNRASPKSAHAMCVFYKCISCPCKSKQEHFDGGVAIYTSGLADLVHVSHFESLKTRTMSCSNAVKHLLKNAMCGSCKQIHDGVGSTNVCEYIDIHKKTQNCALCKKNNAECSKKAGVVQVPICNNCLGLGHEELLCKTLRLVVKMFGAFKITVNSNMSLKDTHAKQTFTDIVVKFKNNDCRGIIVIEVDEQQHINRKPCDEINKIVSQTSTVLNAERRLVEQAGCDPNNVKVMIIRVNPNVEYNTSHNTKVHGNKKENLSREARYLILRQWVIWFMLEIEKIRHCTILYMFYDQSRRSKYFGHDFPGFGIIYNAPKPENAEHQWLYCADVSEVPTIYKQNKHDSLLKTIYHNRMPIPEAFYENFGDPWPKQIKEVLK